MNKSDAQPLVAIATSQLTTVTGGVMDPIYLPSPGGRPGTTLPPTSHRGSHGATMDPSPSHATRPSGSCRPAPLKLPPGFWGGGQDPAVLEGRFHV